MEEQTEQNDWEFRKGPRKRSYMLDQGWDAYGTQRLKDGEVTGGGEGQREKCVLDPHLETSQEIVVQGGHSASGEEGTK